MINSKYKSIAFLSIFFAALYCLSPGALAQQTQEDSLGYYLQIAAKNNPVVLQRFAEYESALQKIPQVGSLPDPELSIGVFLSPMELVEGRQVADFRLMQMFPWFKTLGAARDEMSLMAKAKFEIFRDSKLQVYFDVQRTWLELYKTGEEIRIAEINLGILQTIERLTLSSFKSASVNSGNIQDNISSDAGSQSASAGMQGMTGSSALSSAQRANQSTPMQNSEMASAIGISGLADIYRVQMEMGELENNISQLHNDRTILLARFNAYLNRPALSPVSADTLLPDSLEFSLVQVSDSMLSNNPMLGMLRFEQESQEARHAMVTRMGNPMFGLGLNYALINKNEMLTSEMNGKDMIMPMITLTLPVYRKKYKSMQTESELMHTATKQNYTSTANALEVEYYEAVKLYDDALRRNKLYTNQSLLSDKTLEILLKSFQSSGSSLTDILRTRQQILDYEFRQVEAQVDFQTAIAWMKRLMAITETE